MSAWRSRTSASKRRVGRAGRGLVARDDLDLAAPQARRDLQRRRGPCPSPRRRRSVSAISDSGMPNRRSIALRVARPRPPTRRAERLASRSAGAPHRLQLARRPGQHDDRRAAAVDAGGTTSPGAVPTGSRTVAPAGTTACLRLPRADRVGVEVGPALQQRLEDRRDPLLAAARRATISRPWNAADDLGRQVVGGRPEPAARDDQRRRRCAARKRSAPRPCPRGRSPTTTIVRVVDAELAQPLGQPRAVAVASRGR